MFFSEVWNNVPAGSRLTVRISNSAGIGLSGSHTVSTQNGPILKGPITHNQFPMDIPVQAMEAHKVKFDVLFAGVQSSVSIIAEIVDPGGNTFGQPASFTGAVGAASPVLTVKIFANG